jgi:hypothetical protein
VRIMVDHHMDAWLHRRAVICMRTADVWARLGPFFSSSARFRGGTYDAARPRLPAKKKNGRRTATKTGMPNGRPVVGGSLQHMRKTSARERANASILELLTLMRPPPPLPLAGREFANANSPLYAAAIRMEFSIANRASTRGHPNYRKNSRSSSDNASEKKDFCCNFSAVSFIFSRTIRRPVSSSHPC